MTDWSKIQAEIGSLVWYTAYKMLGNAADAEDCYQEAFIDAYTLSACQRILNHKSLLTRLVIRRAIDMLRQRYRESQLPAIDGLNLDSLTSSLSGPETRAEVSELSEKLRQAIMQLSEKEMLVICLCSMRGLSYKEAGKEMDISPGAVAVFLARTKKKLKRFLSDPSIKVGEEPKHEGP